MSDFINRLLREARTEIEEAQERIDRAQFLIDQFEPKARHRRKRRVLSPEQRELEAGLRVATVGVRDHEREQLRRGVHDVRYVTTGGEQDG